MPQLPIYCPQQPLPAYTYMPGKTPHPTRDPGGHLFGKDSAPVTRPDPRHWKQCRPYLHGIDLFNHGYYWEAHEAWESVWHACGRRGVTADFLRALIRLAAAGFKARQGQAQGQQRHAQAAGQLFEEIASRRDAGPCGRYMGLDLDELRLFAQRSELAGSTASRQDDKRVEAVFDFTLQPRD